MAQREGGSKQSKGKKNRKLGRNKNYVAARASDGRDLKNRIKRVARHLARCDKNGLDKFSQRLLTQLRAMK